MTNFYAGAIGFILGAVWMYAIANGVIREMERWRGSGYQPHGNNLAPSQNPPNVGSGGK